VLNEGAMSILAVVASWSQDPARLGVARRMVACLADRAPDGTAAVEAPGAALGFGKLVVSHKQGHRQQPLVDPAAGLYLVADVRIDNRDELRPQLDLPASATDADIVLAGYRKWGPLVPDHLIGDFAFAVWDAREHRLFAARDPFGVRPLVHRRLPDGRLLVASDVEQILAVDPTAWEVDDAAVVDYLLMQWRSADRTFWEPIKALPAGHCLMASDRSTQIIRWWRPPAEPQIIEDHEACYEEFRRRFRLAVADRLESDHPVLAQLSGGYDSSCIALVAAQIPARIPLRAVGAIHPGLECDESSYMDLLKARLTIPVEYWDGTKHSFADLDDPCLAGPNRRCTMNNGTRGDLEIAARAQARVILSGHGGDAWTPSMANFRDYISTGHWRQLWVGAFLRPNRTWPQRFRSVRKSIRHVVPEPMKRTLRRMRGKDRRPPVWLAPRMARVFAAEDRRFSVASASYGLANLQRLDELAGPKAGRTLDAQHDANPGACVEKRFPFLDARLVDLLWRLPLSIWRAPAYEARFHAAVFADLFPPEMLQPRKKTVFSSVLNQRMSQAARTAPLFTAGDKAPWLATRYVLPEAVEALRSLGDTSRPDSGSAYTMALRSAMLAAMLDRGLGWRLIALEPWLRIAYGQARKSAVVSGGQDGQASDRYNDRHQIG
jgi:asparagine synthase (glutamine-hydrolysing)